MLAAFGHHGFDMAGQKVDALDRAADIFVRLRRARHHRAARSNPAKSAVVADVALAVRSHRRAVGSTGNLGNRLFATVRPHPGQPAAPDFDQHHRAVRQHHRSFGKFEAGGDHANVGHESSRLCWARRIQGSFPHAQSFAPRCYGKVDIACQAITTRRETQSSQPQAYSRTGSQISRPPLPVIGSKFSPYRSKLGASAALNPEAGNQWFQIVLMVRRMLEMWSPWVNTA